jgi:hypothetical protein
MNNWKSIHIFIVDKLRGRARASSALKATAQNGKVTVSMIVIGNLCDCERSTAEEQCISL